jgi:hypothetical protein
MIRSNLIAINLIALASIVYLQWPFTHHFYDKIIKPKPFVAFVLTSSVIAHSLLIVNVMFRLCQKGILLFMFGIGSKVPGWRVFVALSDIITLAVSSRFQFQFQ